MENGKKTEFEEIEETQERDETEDIMSKVEQILGSVQSGYSISIYRVRPSWCKGFLERIELLGNEPVDLEYLADTWGGDVLRLRICDKTGTYRGGCDVPMMSYPPRFRGKKLVRNFALDDDIPAGARLAGQPQFIPMPQAQNNNLETVLNILKQTRSEDLATMRDLLTSVPIEPPIVGNTLGNVVELAQQFQELKSIFGGAETALAAQDDQSALFSTIGEVIKAVLQKPQQPPQQPRRLVQQYPPRPAPMTVSQPQPQPQQQPQPQPQQQQNPSDMLATLDPDAFADSYVMALARMPMEKREKTVQAVLSRLGIEDELNGNYGESDDTDDSDEDDYPDR